MYYAEIHHLGRLHFHARYVVSYATTGREPVFINGWSRSSLSPSGTTIVSMRSTPLLTKATPSTDYTVHVRFEDGLTAYVDLSYLLDYGGVFEPLRDPECFCRLRADGEAGTIVWPNKADIAPETLYAHAQRQAAATA